MSDKSDSKPRSDTQPTDDKMEQVAGKEPRADWTKDSGASEKDWNMKTPKKDTPKEMPAEDSRDAVFNTPIV